MTSDQGDEEYDAARKDIDALGLDLGEVRHRAEAVNPDGSFVFSNLTATGQRLADRSRRNPGGKFNPFDVPRKNRGMDEKSILDEALERMFAPHLLDFRS